ncbi:bifunctional 5,10-methylenetetrahydrofolate dehydrogenase/5,10-methenyltetrahydrofolate cyclohydrolase [Candidatus Uhrbacteria bacterium]|nr:bifunctional 5,10-methylenetetrahydrofolate dehydrogenase/5,10-methenyltetrahydrofolate cyclohydrolase [Candidatus Uhrbacteria bacterium]
MIIDGRALAQTIREKIKQRVSALPSSPGLAVILVGADPASHTYVSIKQKACEEVGIHFEKYLYFETELEETIINKIHELNARKDINGILVQLPLPNQDADRVIVEIDPKKDVDGFHTDNISKLKLGEPALAPAVALGILKLIDSTNEPLSGKTATIISSERFAEPIVALLRERGVVSHVCPEEHSDTKEHATQSDILIVAEGHPNFVTGDMVKQGAIVIDVGTTKVDGKLIGDVDRASVEMVAGFITPVPGGVGPMTVAMLLENVMKARSLQT